MQIDLPELCLVVLIGVSGSGKSTFGKTHFGPYQVISSDFCRGLVSDDENDQSATKDAFELVHYLATKRLQAGKLTVIDATNVTKEARAELIGVARECDVLPVAIVLDTPVAEAAARNENRSDRLFGTQVIHRQHQQLRRSLRGLRREGFRGVHHLTSTDEINQVQINYTKLFNNLKDHHGPFDLIGDIHGCRSELETLLTELGYELVQDANGRAIDAIPPAERRAVFVGDYVDRGPDSAGVLRLVMGMAKAGHAIAIPGNHEVKLVRAMTGKATKVGPDVVATLAQLEQETPEFRQAVQQWCDQLVAHVVLDNGNLVVAHAGLKEAYHGRASARVRNYALYGDVTGERDEYGFPVRYPWANDYRGKAMVVYGHTPVQDVEWVNNTICLDTGCVFGGKLTAMRYPEREFVQVPAEQTWWEPVKPLAPTASTPERAGDELKITDVLGKRGIETEHLGRVTVRAESAAGALEVMSRFAAHPSWLPYLPPTLAPASASTRDGYLEHPEQAFADYRAMGVTKVICEEKHMGSRAVLAIAQSPDVAARVFGATGGQSGLVYTRTGRPFFAPGDMADVVGRVSAALTAAQVWDRLDSPWVLLDAEILPWSYKSGGLIKQQYAPAGAAAESLFTAVESALAGAADRGVPVAELAGRVAQRASNARRYREAYRHYIWPVNDLAGMRIAPFQFLASQGHTWENKDHTWHFELADRLVAVDRQLFQTTAWHLVDVVSPSSQRAGVEWWDNLVSSGGEGMVVKPLANFTKTGRSLVQPGLKVRGPEYLRMIYGMDYTDAETLQVLRSRNLGHKRSMALREYALGLESLRRFVAGDPLWRVHEPVFGVLAMESEPVDPRL